MSTANQYHNVEFPSELLNEQNGLKLDQKKRLLYIESNLLRWNKYELLEVTAFADQNEIKAAFIRLSKELHPDAYFGVNVGTYGSRIDKIFQAVREAYQTLADPLSRARYDAQLYHMQNRAAKPMDPIQKAQSQKRMQMIMERIRKARDMMEQAEKALSESKILEAERQAQLAKDYAPHDKDILQRYNALRQQMAPARAWLYLKKARELVFPERLESGLNGLEMIRSLTIDIRSIHPDSVQESARQTEKALELAPEDAKILAGAASVYARIGNYSRAARLAQKSVDLDNQMMLGWHTLYEISYKEGKYHTAIRAAERLVALKANDVWIQDLLDKARNKLQQQSV